MRLKALKEITVSEHGGKAVTVAEGEEFTLSHGAAARAMVAKKQAEVVERPKVEEAPADAIPGDQRRELRRQAEEDQRFGTPTTDDPERIEAAAEPEKARGKKR